MKSVLAFFGTPHGAILAAGLIVLMPMAPLFFR